MSSPHASMLILWMGVGCVHPDKGDSGDSGDTADDTGPAPRSCEEGAAVVTDAGMWYRSIQDALNVAVDGQELRLCPGVQVGSLDVSINNEVLTPLMEDGGTLTMVGADDGSTILDADGTGPVLQTGYVAFVLRNLTMTGGTGVRWGDGKDFPYSYEGGALNDNGGADLTLESVTIEANSATAGAAIIVRRVYEIPIITLANTVIRDNVGSSGLFLYTAFDFTATDTTWEGNTPPDIHIQDVKMNGFDYTVPAGADVSCTSTPLECVFTKKGG